MYTVVYTTLALNNYNVWSELESNELQLLALLLSSFFVY